MKVIYSVFKNQKEAEKIGKTLVDEKLAGCVNFWPINSYFNWKGKTQKAKEVAMFAKTTENKVQAILTKVKEMHSYDAPAIFVLAVERADSEYLKWLTGCTTFKKS